MLSSSNFVQRGWTALIWACRYGHTDTGRMLLDHGAVIDHCDLEKVSDLQQVATHNVNWFFDLTSLHIG